MVASGNVCSQASLLIYWTLVLRSHQHATCDVSNLLDISAAKYCGAYWVYVQGAAKKQRNT